MYNDLSINFKFLKDIVHLLFLEQLNLMCTEYQLMMVKYKPHTVSAIHPFIPLTQSSLHPTTDRSMHQLVSKILYD